MIVTRSEERGIREVDSIVYSTMLEVSEVSREK